MSVLHQRNGKKPFLAVSFPFTVGGRHYYPSAVGRLKGWYKGGGGTRGAEAGGSLMVKPKIDRVTRLELYETFARTLSLPMFNASQ
jgi:hypothetical protein